MKCGRCWGCRHGRACIERVRRDDTLGSLELDEALENDGSEG